MMQDETREGAPQDISEHEAGRAELSETDGLRSELDARAREAQEWKEKYLRAAAEFENAKRRLKKDRDEAIRFANDNLIRELLGVLDNLERAVAHTKESVEVRPLLEGVELTVKQFGEILERFGVTPIPSVGTPFDPAVHEAMTRVESAEHPPDTVVEEFQRGYRINDRVLRPSMVSVAIAARENGSDGDPAA